MSDDTKWSEWKVHTGEVCPFEDDVRIYFQGDIYPANHFSWVSYTVDSPLFYRHEVKPREVEPFAAVFDEDDGTVYCYSRDDYRVRCLEHAQKRKRQVVFFDKHCNVTERHDFTEDGA